ncbi:hypothetical protein FJY94_00010 [Candidatus Kaiserbacteria bacterium]|nr:hypothetical protein [Candidatus Kaiserbacteria bacterium]
MKFLAFSQRKILGSSLALPANGLGGSRATSLLVAHFALQNTKFGSGKGKVQNPARIPPQTPPAGGKKAERGEKRILGASQGRSATARDWVARFFSRKILVTFHSPRKIVCPAESKLVFRIFVKKCSNFVQKTPPIFTFCEIVRISLGAKRLGMVFFRNFEGIFEIQNQSAIGNAEVRRAKHGQNEILQTNLFSFAFSERLSVFFFDCPKANFKTIWTT